MAAYDQYAEVPMFTKEQQDAAILAFLQRGQVTKVKARKAPKQLTASGKQRLK